MKKTKFGAVLLACCMLAGIFAGCNDKSSGSSDTKASESSVSSTESTEVSTATGDYPDYSAGFPENVTIEIPVYDRAFEGWNVTDNFYTRWVQEEFGNKNNITVKFTAIGRASEVTDYQQLLASHTAPDIVFHYDMPQALAYYGEGVLQELDYNEIKNYAPTYWAKSGTTVEQYGQVDGKNTFVFAERPDAYNYVTLVRKDWIEQVGMKVEDITSLEKYNEMLGKWKEAGLGVGGAPLVKNNFTYNYAFRDWAVDSTDRALYSDLSVADFTSKATEDYLRNFNNQYNQGIIDQEFYLRDEDGKTKAEFVAGKTGSFALFLANNTDVIAALKANDSNAEVAILPVTSGTPEGGTPYERAYWPFGMIMGINYESTPEERTAVWMYLEWLSQPENLFKMQNGVEGENYTLAENGLAVKVDGFAGESVQSQNNNKDYWCLVIESAQYEDKVLNDIANLAYWAPPGYESLIETAKSNYFGNEKNRTPDALYTAIIESVAEYKADLNELWQELYVKCVTAKAEDFDKVYEESKQIYLDAGYQAILDEKQAAIDAGNYVF